jgi:hypothetical protein
LWFVFALVYWMTGSAVHAAGTNARSGTPVTNPLEVGAFSLFAMMSNGSMPFGMTSANEYVQLGAGLESLLAIALTGLLGFILGNRIRR